MTTIRPPDAWTRDEKAKARAILLEPSPWPVDGGELIGRDPRKVPAEAFAQAGLEGNPLLRVIRARCLDCVAGQEVEIRKCVLITCPNWPYRLGSNPFRAAREITDEQREQMAVSLAKARSARNAPPAVLARNISSPKSDEASGGAGKPPEFLEAVNGDGVDPGRDEEPNS